MAPVCGWFIPKKKKGRTKIVLPFVRKRNTDYDYRLVPLLPVPEDPVLDPLPLLPLLSGIPGRVPKSDSDCLAPDEVPVPDDPPAPNDEPPDDEPPMPEGEEPADVLTPSALAVALSNCPLACIFLDF